MATINFPVVDLNDPATLTYTQAGITWTWNNTLGVWSSDLEGGSGGGSGEFLSKVNDDTAAGQITFEGLTTHEAGVNVTGGATTPPATGFGKRDTVDKLEVYTGGAPAAMFGGSLTDNYFAGFSAYGRDMGGEGKNCFSINGSTSTWENVGAGGRISGVYTTVTSATGAAADVDVAGLRVESNSSAAYTNPNTYGLYVNLSPNNNQSAGNKNWSLYCAGQAPNYLKGGINLEGGPGGLSGNGWVGSTNNDIRGIVQGVRRVQITTNGITYSGPDSSRSSSSEKTRFDGYTTGGTPSGKISNMFYASYDPADLNSSYSQTLVAARFDIVGNVSGTGSFTYFRATGGTGNQDNVSNVSGFVSTIDKGTGVNRKNLNITGDADNYLVGIVNSEAGFRSNGTYNNTTTSGSANIRIHSNGTFQRHTSSRRYKNNIRDLSLPNAFDATSFIKGLQPRMWEDYQSGDTVIGLIAEEVYALGGSQFVEFAPWSQEKETTSYDENENAVVTTSTIYPRAGNGTTPVTKDGGDLTNESEVVDSINQTAMLVAMTKALQDALARIEALENA